MGPRKAHDNIALYGSLCYWKKKGASMLRFLLSVSCLLACFPANGLDSVTIQTVQQQTVQVTPAEIFRVARLSQVYHTLNKGGIEPNGDGTSTIKVPRIHFNGEDYPVWSGEQYGVDFNKLGTCKSFGFQRVANLKAEVEEVHNQPVVTLASDGTVTGIKSQETISIIQSIECKDLEW
jgi:hypothetical protein